MNITKRTAVASLGLAVLLLAGCTSADMANMNNQNGGGADAGSSNTEPAPDAAADPSTAGGGDVIAKNDKGLPFTFGGARTAPGTEPSVNGVNVVIPDDLKEAIGKEAASRLPINGFVITPRKLEGLKYCAVDVEIDYADKSTFEGFSIKPTNGVKFVTQVKVGDGDGEYAEGWTSLLPGDAQLPDSVSFSPAAAIRMAVMDNSIHEGLTASEHSDKLWVDSDDLSASYWNKKLPNIKQLDEGNLEPAKYVSDDLSTLTYVTECSPNPSDDKGQFRLDLPEVVKNPKFDGYTRFATMTVSVMVDGTVSVNGELRHYTRDANGGWIAR